MPFDAKGFDISLFNLHFHFHFYWGKRHDPNDQTVVEVKKVRYIFEDYVRDPVTGEDILIPHPPQKIKA